jgi:hypothetical protein
MHPRRRTVYLHLLTLIVMGLGLFSSACSSSNAISKVKIYRLRLDEPLVAVDPSINFERKYRLHGALTLEEMRAREGNYYTIFWDTENTQQPVTLKFEYRQAKTAAKILTKTVTIDQPGSSNKTEFTVLGPEFIEGGKVLSWRVSLIQNKKTVATRQSYLWE